MEYRRTSVITDETISADGSYNKDLPVKPLSHIIFTVKCLNASVKATLAQILGAIETIEILRYGSALVSISGADLYALNCILLGHQPWQENVVDTDNAVRHLTMMIPFGRTLFNPNECIEETARGELTLRYTVDIADTGYDGLILQAEAVELVDAQPSAHLKYTVLSRTPTATGEMDIELPIGNKYLGMLLWGTTVPTGTAWTATIEYIKLLMDNIQRYISEAYWESLHGDFINRLDPAGAWGEKFHVENTASSYTQNADTAGEQQDNTNIANYAYIDFDPNRDDQFIFDSKGLSDLVLRVNAGDTNALRILPIELVDVAGTAPAARVAQRVAMPPPPPFPSMAAEQTGYKPSWR